MAKKKKEVVEETTTKETVIMEKPVVKKEEPQKPKWEIKDRVYYLKGRQKPLTYSIRSSNIYYFDEEKGYERELKYCQNQKTPFVDEMQGDQRLEHIVFQNGALFVSKEKTTLQKLMSKYHPHLNKLYYEYKPVEIAKNQLDWLEFEVEALKIAKDLDIDMVEAIMRAEVGSNVSRMSSKELRRDCILFARNNPQLFLELVADDNVQLRNFGIKAVEAGILSLSQDQRYFTWASNNRKVMTVPYEEHPYAALAAWFKTDEGVEMYSNIEKRLG